MVEFFSAEMVLSVWRYRSCKAEGDSDMTSEASFNERAASRSPFAAITCKNEEIGLVRRLQLASMRATGAEIKPWVRGCVYIPTFLSYFLACIAI